MMSAQSKCLICGELREGCVGVPALRGSLVGFMRTRHPEGWRPDGPICRPCLSVERQALLLAQLEVERGELSVLEEEVSRKAAEHIAIAAHLEESFQRDQTFGQRLADRVATVGGSWPFVVGFGAVLAIWITANSVALQRSPFDPYPFILLNLVLSCLAAIQAPIIMMSQNRAALRDRMEADEDYKINLKAELEIAGLHDKMDHLLHVQWARMVEIQQAQIELLTELSGRLPVDAKASEEQAARAAPLSAPPAVIVE